VLPRWIDGHVGREFRRLKSRCGSLCHESERVDDSWNAASVQDRCDDTIARTRDTGWRWPNSLAFRSRGVTAAGEGTLLLAAGGPISRGGIGWRGAKRRITT
jgi:hypothetical protein